MKKSFRHGVEFTVCHEYALKQCRPTPWCADNKNAIHCLMIPRAKLGENVA